MISVLSRLMDSMLNLLIHECQTAQSSEHKPKMLYTPTRAKDGYVIVTPITQKNFEEMAVAMGHPDWVTDARFSSDAERREHWPELLAQMEAWTSSREAKQCEQILSAAGVPCSRYRTVGEAIADPQCQARELMAEVKSDTGQFLVPNAPFVFADGSVRLTPTVPALGADNDSILNGHGNHRD